MAQPARFISCINCTHAVSPNASECPKCGEREFNGVNCKICQSRLKKNGLYHLDRSISIYDIPDTITDYYCETCLVQHFTPPRQWKCVECHAPINDSSMSDVLGHGPQLHNYSQAKCMNCGTRKPYSAVDWSCHFCHLPLLAFQDIRKELHHYDNSGTSYTPPEKIPHHHGFCGHQNTKHATQSKGCLVMLLALVALSFSLVAACLP